MSINNALNNASLGLSAASRLADTVSNNVANAMTPGFGRRVTELTSLAIGGYGSGVQARVTTRTENPYLTAERRAMDASLGAAATTAATYQRLVDALGEPGSEGALATRATTLETALMSTVSEPQSLSRLADAVSAAGSLAGELNATSLENSRLRSEADAEIARQVETVNRSLHRISDLNGKISELTMRGEDVTGLQDERDRVLDTITSIVPVRTVKRDAGAIAIYANGGGVLLDGSVRELVFTRGPSEITAEMSVETALNPGQLSGLRQERGDAAGPSWVPVGTGSGLFDGGSLAALFDVRDNIVPQFQGEIDLYAAELVSRFRDLVPPASLDAAGDGLFVDTAGTNVLTGLATRIGLNDAVVGAAWRLRDGLSATVIGNEGKGDFLQGLADAMSTARTATGFISQNAANSAAIMASEITSFFAGKAARSDDAQAFLTARQTVLADSETNAIGVDSDSELQALMVIEKVYAANARVLSVIDGLMQTLLEI